mmetsp:Transcript_10053/g.14418  ORF Transcript_10053/g.14418 Transcript_10053/m.14418 type:complete len:216 (-) Transcript_10053:1581-2228(-)
MHNHMGTIRKIHHLRLPNVGLIVPLRKIRLGMEFTWQIVRGVVSLVAVVVVRGMRFQKLVHMNMTQLRLMVLHPLQRGSNHSSRSSNNHVLRLEHVNYSKNWAFSPALWTVSRDCHPIYQRFSTNMNEMNQRTTRRKRICALCPWNGLNGSPKNYVTFPHSSTSHCTIASSSYGSSTLPVNKSSCPRCQWSHLECFITFGIQKWHPTIKMNGSFG